jgi:hypothetical protein
MMKKQWMTSVVALLLGAFAASSASAGIILSGTPVAASPGLGSVTIPLILTVTPNNDNTADANSNNNITIATKAFQHNDYIDIVFVVQPTAPFTNPGVATEYRVVETIDNATGIDWKNYTMQLGFGTGAGFTTTATADGLDFDTGTPGNDPPPSSTAMPTVSRPNDDTLLYSGGIHSSIQQTYEFHLDVPNLAGDANYTFTLRQFPTPIPEPATVLLALSFLAVPVFLRRRA